MITKPQQRIINTIVYMNGKLAADAVAGNERFFILGLKNLIHDLQSGLAEISTPPRVIVDPADDDEL